MSTINKINEFSQSEFTKVFANIFEGAAWIPEELYSQKPFLDFQDLCSKMLDIFENTTKEKQLKIIKAHPDLADKTKIGLLTIDSKKEQSNAGLDQCSEREYNEFKDLNKTSIGIELVNKGHRFGYTNFKKEQLSSLIKICNNPMSLHSSQKNLCII